MAGERRRRPRAGCGGSMACACLVWHGLRPATVGKAAIFATAAASDGPLGAGTAAERRNDNDGVSLSGLVCELGRRRIPAGLGADARPTSPHVGRCAMPHPVELTPRRDRSPSWPPRTNEEEPVTLHDLAYSSSPRSADPPVSVNPSVHVSTLHELAQDAVETTLRPAEGVLKNRSGSTGIQRLAAAIGSSGGFVQRRPGSRHRLHDAGHGACTGSAEMAAGRRRPPGRPKTEAVNPADSRAECSYNAKSTPVSSTDLSHRNSPVPGPSAVSGSGTTPAGPAEPRCFVGP